VETVWDSLARHDNRTQLTSGDGWLSYDPVAISRLDAQGRKKRRSSLAQRRQTGLSSLLRTVGDYDLENHQSASSHHDRPFYLKVELAGERREAERIIEARELMARYSARSCPKCNGYLGIVLPNRQPRAVVRAINGA
jgi:hypothetical protein